MGIDVNKRIYKCKHLFGAMKVSKDLVHTNLLERKCIEMTSFFTIRVLIEMYLPKCLVWKTFTSVSASPLFFVSLSPNLIT
ncbi:hypothetical protein HanIR_Chr06g0286161 [Helianthus annuus]|nr:hypothetical protein HanIR_Chr06g0286161 [Helianthus annuus]